MLRRSLLLGLALTAAAGSARAAIFQPFTDQALGAAQEADKPILIAVHASWCPICAKQRPIIDSLMTRPEFKDLVILRVDFDAQKDIVQALGVRKQSTLIAMHGSAERDRSVGVTAEDAILALMRKALT